MRTITLLEKAYGTYKFPAMKAFRQSISKELDGLEVQINKIFTHPHDWITVELEGDDEEAAYNLLRYNFGTTCSFGEIKIGETRRGKLLETGKYGYGVFIDIGIDSKRRVDAFLPLNTFRRQLGNNEKIPLRKLIYIYGFIDNLPLEIKIEELDQTKEKIQVSLSEMQLYTFRNWIKAKLERLIVCGVSRHHLKKVITRSGHFRDIVAIERLGVLEEMIICKRGTNAPGMLSEIGSLLPESKIQLFIPAKVRNYLS